MRILRRVEAIAVMLATGGAVSGLNGLHPAGIELDRWGMFADLVAGAIALAHWTHHRRHHKPHTPGAFCAVLPPVAPLPDGRTEPTP